MESHEKYLRDLKQWLRDTSDTPPEEMSDFKFYGRNEKARKCKK